MGLIWTIILRFQIQEIEIDVVSFLSFYQILRTSMRFLPEKNLIIIINIHSTLNLLIFIIFLSLPILLLHPHGTLVISKNSYVSKRERRIVRVKNSFVWPWRCLGALLRTHVCVHKAQQEEIVYFSFYTLKRISTVKSLSHDKLASNFFRTKVPWKREKIFHNSSSNLIEIISIEA